jgi:hypothetical protein
VLRRTSSSALIVAAGATLVLAIATPAALGGADPAAPCRATACWAEMKVGEDELKWRSIENFYPHNEELAATLTARGRNLRVLETWGPEGCRSAYRGSGIVAVVKACGEETPLRIRAYRMKRKRVKLVVSYKATPVMGG